MKSSDKTPKKADAKTTGASKPAKKKLVEKAKPLSDEELAGVAGGSDTTWGRVRSMQSTRTRGTANTIDAD